jgi:hypothetical protein
LFLAVDQNFAQRIHDEFHDMGVRVDLTDLKDCDPDEALTVEEVRFYTGCIFLRFSVL